MKKINLIGIAGKAQSGKDTVGNMLAYLTGANTEHFKFNNNGSWYEQSIFNKKQFAYPLKKMASILLGVPIIVFEDPEFKNSKLGPEWNYSKDIFLGKKPFEVFSHTEIHNMTVRELLQKLGTDAIRNGLHKNSWVNAAFANYTQIVDSQVTHNPDWIFTDVRFPNEYDSIKDRGGILIKVVRSWGSTRDLFDQHESETALDNFEFDEIIENNGTMKDLLVKVKLIKEKYNL